jgi:hypothetical protein
MIKDMNDNKQQKRNRLVTSHLVWNPKKKERRSEKSPFPGWVLLKAVLVAGFEE